MRALLIAEKPSLMRELKNVYEKSTCIKDQIDFVSLNGHILELYKPDDYDKKYEKWNKEDIPIIPKLFLHKPIQQKIKIFQDIKNKIKNGKYDYIIHAGDPDREGTLLVNELLDFLKCNLPVKRAWWNDLTEKELLRAFSELLDNNCNELINLNNAAKLREEFDWLIGMNISRAYTLRAFETKAHQGTISIGRCMTTILEIVNQKEKEVREFTPIEYFEIEIEFENFRGFVLKNEKDIQFYEKNEVFKILKQISSCDIAKVTDVKETIESNSPPKLYSLTELQKEAYKVYKYTAADTLNFAQLLYEKKYITYPRVDNCFLTQKIADEFNNLLKKLKNIDMYKDEIIKIEEDKVKIETIKKNSAYIDDSKVTGHYAIIPTGKTSQIKELSQEEKNIFDLICKRFISIFLGEEIIAQRNIILQIGNTRCLVKGKTTVNSGYKKLYPSEKKEKLLPQCFIGEDIKIKNRKLLNKESSPPERYNDGTLIAILENPGGLVADKKVRKYLKECKGIGTPATRSEIIEKLVSKKMLLREKGYYTPTKYGQWIVENLKNANSELISPVLTGEWEEKLRLIEQGRYEEKNFRQEMRFFIEKTTREVLNMNLNLNTEIIGVCPECGGRVVKLKTGYVCEFYKSKCKLFIPIKFCGTEITTVEARKLLEKIDTKIFKFNYNNKQWECKLAWDVNQGKLIFNNKK